MRVLYIVTKKDIETLFEGKDFIEKDIYYIVKNEKIYKVQFEELIVYDCEVAALTFNPKKIHYFMKEINEFYSKYYKQIKAI